MFTDNESIVKRTISEIIRHFKSAGNEEMPPVVKEESIVIEPTPVIDSPMLQLVDIQIGLGSRCSPRRRRR